jgi:hypothetical protein
VEALGVVFTAQLDVEISKSELERGLRMGASLDAVNRWTVAQRIRRWEEETGLVVLSDGPAA